MRYFMLVLCWLGTLCAQVSSSQSLQQLRDLIPERNWDQQFSLVVARKAFDRPLHQWLSQHVHEQSICPSITFGISKEYFLRYTIAGDYIRILDRFEDFHFSPFWESPLFLQQLYELKKKVWEDLQ